MFFVNVRLKCIFLALEESTSQKTPPPFGFFIATPGWSPSAVGLVGRPCRAGRLMQNWHINLANFFTSTNGIRERDWWPYFRRTQVICSVTYTALAAAANQLLPPACPTACHLLACRLIRHRGQPLILLRAILIYQCKKMPLPSFSLQLLIWKLSSVVFHTFSFEPVH